MRRSCESPRALGQSDLSPLREAVGEAAVEYAAVIAGFHFINRIADLLEVAPEALPAPLRRVEILRRMVVRVAGRTFRGMDIDNRTYGEEFESQAALLAASMARDADALARALEPLRAHAQLVEVLRHAVEERDRRSSLPRETLVRVHRIVEDALPWSRADVEGFHARPADPVDAFAFVGTRYAQRTTRAMIDALRAAGYDDVGILDLAIAVADANQWARLSRLVGLPHGVFSLTDASVKRAVA